MSKRKKKLNETIINDKSLKNDLDCIKKSNDLFSWLIEFSKKVVFGTFIVFLISTIVEIVLLFLYYRNGDSTGFETFITEINATFKVVVAGYCIKATFENILKINSSNTIDLIKIKNKLFKHKLNKETGVEFDENNNNNDDTDTINEDNNIDENINDMEDC